MASTRRSLRTSLIVAVLVPLAAATARAQSTPPTITPVTVEGYYSYYALDRQSGARLGMSGGGLRLLWNPVEDSTVHPQFALGLFGEFAPNQSRGFSMARAGVEGDLLFTHTRLFGRITPLASLGAGVLWTTIQDSVAAAGSRFSLAAHKTSTLALSPDVGVRVGMWRALGARADVSDIVTIQNTTINNLQFSAGLSYPF